MKGKAILIQKDPQMNNTQQLQTDNVFANNVKILTYSK